jgi:hypothetical protein
MLRKLAVAAAAAIIASAGLAFDSASAQIRPHGGFGGGAHFAPHGFGGRAFGGMGRFSPRGFGARGFAASRFAHPGGFGPYAHAGRFGATAAALGATHGYYHHGWYGWQGYRRGYVGWGGPVFWPFAYDDLFGYAFWPYGPYDDLFWSYGYDDLFAGILLPFAAPRGGYAYGAPSPRVAGAPTPQPSPQADAQPQASGGVPTSASQLCVSAQSLAGGAAIDPIAKAVQPTPDQNAKLDALKTAETDAEKALADSCSQQAPTTTVARLDAVQGRLQAMIQAANTVGGPLNDFYASLNDEQKARFNALGANKTGAALDFAQLCGPNNALPAIAVGEISSAVKPDDKQRQALNALRDAAGKADDAIVASCPKAAPMTPTGRLDAVKARLQAMLDGVNIVKQPLQDFYASLNDEQKSRFDALTQSPNAADQQHAETQP